MIAHGFFSDGWRINVLRTAMLLVGLTSALPSIAAETGDRRIVVGGHGVVTTPPDVAIINFTARGEGSTSDDAVRAMVAARSQALSSVAAISPSAQINDDKPKITAVRSAECKGSDDDDNPRLSTGKCATLGYVASMAVQVRTTALHDAGTMVSAVGRVAGANPSLDTFQLSNARIAEQQAIAAAIANARTAAEAMASAGHVELGPVRSISNTVDSDRPMMDIVVTAHRYAPPSPMVAPPPVAITLTPQPIETTANVTVVFEIH